MTIVRFELRDQTKLSIHVERVMQPERSAQLAHTQVPLQRFGVVRESESLLASLPERNRLTQTVNELKRRRQKRISQPERFTS